MGTSVANSRTRRGHGGWCTIHSSPWGAERVAGEAIPLHSLSSCDSEASEGADAAAAKTARSTFLPVSTSSAVRLDGSSPPCPTSQVQNGP